MNNFHRIYNFHIYTTFLVFWVILEAILCKHLKRFKAIFHRITTDFTGNGTVRTLPMKTNSTSVVVTGLTNPHVVDLYDNKYYVGEYNNKNIIVCSKNWVEIQRFNTTDEPLSTLFTSFDTIWVAEKKWVKEYDMQGEYIKTEIDNKQLGGRPSGFVIHENFPEYLWVVVMGNSFANFTLQRYKI